MPREDGPTLEFHRHFFVEGHYARHILLYSNPKDELAVDHLASAIRREFPGREVQTELLKVTDVIDLEQVKTRVETRLLNFPARQPITIYFSPGTSIMQLAWFICHNTLGLNTRLVQTRPGHFEPNGIPKLMELQVEQSAVPLSAMLRERQLKAGEPAQSVAGESHLIGASLQTVYQQAMQVAQTDKVTVLIRGESGTGKERLAHYIHEQSVRKNGPFRALNCAALTDTLLESRLFGHKKGAFTGADRDAEGEFKAAEGGTLFLDEIGDISPALQVALLRVLQSDEIQPLGGKPQKVNVRVVAATHAELEERCEQGLFRWDLFYRLAVAELELPPLRHWTRHERDDLIEHLMRQQQIALRKPASLKLSAATRKLLLEHAFPGNVRELENIITRLYIFATAPDAPVQPTHLPARLQHAHAVKVLALCKGVKARAAKAMDIDPRTLDKYLLGGQ